MYVTLIALRRQQWLLERASMLRSHVHYLSYLSFNVSSVMYFHTLYATSRFCFPPLTLNIQSLARQRCLSSWGPRRTPWFFFVISQLFDAVDYSNYVFWVSETIIQ